MHDRDLDITKFSYFSYRKLKKTLGEFDAVVECNEIAINEFVERAKKEDIREYISRLSLKHNVRVDEVDFLKFNARIRQYYVTSVFQQSEQFLQDFKAEWLLYYPEKKWVELKKGETVFQNTLSNISLSFSNDLIDVYDYYRLVRNYMAHTNRDLPDIKKKHRKIVSNENEFLSELHISFTPHSIDEIDFSDFLILTNIVKHIAYVISTSSKPENARIAEILLENTKKNESSAFKGIKKLKNNNERYEKAIKSYITTNFGRFSGEDLESIYVELKSLLA